MSTRIYEIIETLKEGQEVTIVLMDGQQMCGLYRGIDGDDLLLKAKSGNAPMLGWNVSNIEDIITDDLEPAGNVVKVDVVDVKTGRRVAITIDLSGEEGKCHVEFSPTISADEKGYYIHIASKFMESLTK